MTELAGAGGCFTLPTAALGTRQQRDAQRLCLPNCAGGFASTQHRGSSGCAPPTQRRQQRTRTPTDLAAATTTTTAGRSLRPSHSRWGLEAHQSPCRDSSCYYCRHLLSPRRSSTPQILTVSGSARG